MGFSNFSLAVPLFGIITVILSGQLLIPIPGALALTNNVAMDRKVRQRAADAHRVKTTGKEAGKKQRKTASTNAQRPFPAKDPLILDQPKEAGTGGGSFPSRDPLMDDFVEDDDNSLDEVPVDADGTPLDDLGGVNENAALSRDFPEDANNPLDKFEPKSGEDSLKSAEELEEDLDGGDPEGSIASVEGTTHADYKKDDGKHPGDLGTLDNITLEEADLDGVHENADLSKDLPSDARDPLDKYDPSSNLPDDSDATEGSSEAGDNNADAENSDAATGGSGEDNTQETGKKIIIDEHVDPNTDQVEKSKDSEETGAEEDGDAGVSDDDDEETENNLGPIIIDKHVDPNANETAAGGEGDNKPGIEEESNEGDKEKGKTADGAAEEGTDNASFGHKETDKDKENDNLRKDEGAQGDEKEAGDVDDDIDRSEDGEIIVDKHVDPNADDVTAQNEEEENDEEEDGGEAPDVEAVGNVTVNTTNETLATAESEAEKGVTIPGCVTREDPRIRKASWKVSVAKAGTPCVVGVDERDEGEHCIFETDYRFGSYGWCWTKANRGEWGSCGPDCPLFGQAQILEDKIDKLHAIVAKALGKNPEPESDEAVDAGASNETNATIKNASFAFLVAKAQDNLKNLKIGTKESIHSTIKRTNESVSRQAASKAH